MSVPPNLDRPPEVRPGRVAGASGDLAALVGEPPAGTPRRSPVLLVAGYTGSKEDFLPVLGPLARAGHPVVAVDLPGQYETPGPDDPSAYTLDALAKDVAAALAGLGEPAHLVGHSFGGLVVRRAVLAGARPRSLTLVGSGPAAIGGRRAAVVELMRPALAAGDLTGIADASAALDAEDPRMASVGPGVVEFLRERWLRSSATGLLAMGHELLNAPDEVDRLAAVGLPTLVTHGDTDDAWPPEVQREMAERLGSAYVVIDGAAHSPACEAPEPFAATLREFWSALP